MRTLRYVLIDVFTDRPLTGNALAVFTDARGLDDVTMQALARELALSETTFVLPATAGGHARVRIFTPARELPFAGHPILGTAFVLGQPMQTNVVRLETEAGVITVRLEHDGARVAFGWMHQPTPVVTSFAERAALLAALGVQGEPTLPVELYDNGPTHALVMLPTREAVAALTPDLGRLAKLPVACTSVFTASGSEGKTRMFAPGAGVPEDPATGSAAGPIALHLVRHDRLPRGETLRLEQGAEVARPSTLFARVVADPNGGDAVEVGGAAVFVARGEFRLPGLRGEASM